MTTQTWVDPAGLETLSQHIAGLLGPAQRHSEIRFGELTVHVSADQIVSVLKTLRDDQRCLFTTFIDLTAVDYPARAQRFEIVYHLLSMRKNQRIRIKTTTDEDTPVATITGLWPCADWYEREVFDMFGVAFAGHPDLRRILTDYGFQGHPLRKEFPMTGFVEVRYDPEQQRVVYEPVKLPAAFRNFDFLSPWEGMLPGDEKANT
jgi:NADH-quinone oxidoreductase subunit C